MTIYDGPDNLAEKIGTYCGQMRNLVVFSTKNQLYVTFTTLKRTAQVFNRGFYGLYDFSEDYVKLGNIYYIYQIIRLLTDRFHTKFRCRTYSGN